MSSFWGFGPTKTWKIVYFCVYFLGWQGTIEWSSMCSLVAYTCAWNRWGLRQWLGGQKFGAHWMVSLRDDFQPIWLGYWWNLQVLVTWTVWQMAQKINHTFWDESDESFTYIQIHSYSYIYVIWFWKSWISEISWHYIIWLYMMLCVLYN